MCLCHAKLQQERIQDTCKKAMPTTVDVSCDAAAGAVSIPYGSSSNSLKGVHRSSLMPQRAAAKAAAAAPPPAPSMSAVSTASTLPGQPTHSGVQPPQPQSGLQSQASLGSQAGGQSSPMDIGAGAASDAASKRGSNAAANMPSLQPGRLGLGLGLKPTSNTGELRKQSPCPAFFLPQTLQVSHTSTALQQYRCRPYHGAALDSMLWAALALGYDCRTCRAPGAASCGMHTYCCPSFIKMAFFVRRPVEWATVGCEA